MSEIQAVPIENPEEGDTVELPKTVGRVDAWHDYRGSAGGTRFEMTVVGSGELAEYVLLSTGIGESEIEDGAQVLATDVEHAAVWYAVPLSAYGGGA
ncbi:hypothetical protein [Halobacterium litoreum]|uniref:Uncharacterized protein n=1 Tax=Halobacterium litoreum TaxID=2039234 RepID=A0ABD5NEM0_9EURY|nr:hypothetical protein [Halobacterium litoreum]UHH13476.1 hypothetical protein LT972_00425 [Halobacterium litoreum]